MSSNRLPPLPFSVVLSVMLHATALFLYATDKAFEKPAPQTLRYMARADKPLEVTFTTAAPVHTGLKNQHQAQTLVSSKNSSPSAAKNITTSKQKSKTTKKIKGASKALHSPKPVTSRPVPEKTNHHPTPRRETNPVQTTALIPVKPTLDYQAATAQPSIPQSSPALAGLGNSQSHARLPSKGLDSNGNAKKVLTISSTLPPIAKSVDPSYPEEARWEDRAGKVTVKFKISHQGRVVEPSISGGSGHRDLDMAAIKAIKQWRFVIKDEANTSHWFLYSFRFELH